MKTLNLTLCLLAALTISSKVNAETWACGPRDAADRTVFHNSVLATIEVDPFTQDSILRIYQNKEIVIPGESIAIASFDVLAFDVTGSIAQTDAPWESCAKNIDHVIVENGIERIGKYAFYTMTNLRSLTLPNTIDAIEEWILSDDFGQTNSPLTDIYYINISREWPPFTQNEEYNFQTRSNVILRVPNNDALARYNSADYGVWWNNFSNIEVSLEAAAVIVVPQDKITDSKAVILVEWLYDAERYKVKVESEDGTDIRHFFTSYDEVNDKWIITPIDPNPLARRLPAIRRDTVTRTTETLQIDITNLKAASSYSYEVTALNSADEPIAQQSGAFKTQAKQEPMGLEDVIKPEDKHKGNKCYNVLGQPIDNSYHGFIITEQGEKILRLW